MRGRGIALWFRTRWNITSACDKLGYNVIPLLKKWVVNFFIVFCLSCVFFYFFLNFETLVFEKTEINYTTFSRERANEWLQWSERANEWAQWSAQTKHADGANVAEQANELPVPILGCSRPSCRDSRAFITSGRRLKDVYRVKGSSLSIFWRQYLVIEDAYRNSEPMAVIESQYGK